MISLGELPLGQYKCETRLEASSDLDRLTLWFTSALDHHKKECDANIAKRLDSLQAVIVKHIVELGEQLHDYDEIQDMHDGTAHGLIHEICNLGNAGTTSKHATSNAALEDNYPSGIGIGADPDSITIDADSAKPDRQISAASQSESGSRLKNLHESLSIISKRVHGITKEITRELSGRKHDTHEQSLYHHEADWDEYHQHVEGSLLGKAVTSSVFDIVVAAAIVASALFMFVELQWFGDKARVALGYQVVSSWGDPTATFHISEHCFNAFFLTELIARIVHLKCGFLKDGFAMMDCLLVTSSSLQLYVLGPLEISAAGRSTVFRLIRLTRLTRVLRFVRVMKLCSELRVLVNTCVSCIQALVWSMVFLGVIMLSCALFMTQLIHETIIDSDKDMDTRVWCYRYYGSAIRSAYTLFEITLAGCWPTYFRPLVENVSAAYSILAFFYISMVVFALIRIITALFLKETLRVASADTQSVINEQARKKKDSLLKLQRVFKAMDEKGQGKIDLRDFHRVVTHPAIQCILQELGMELHDTHMLARLLDDGDGFITYDEFVQGTIRLRGQAREIDVIAILHSEDKVKEMLQNLTEQVEEVTAKLDSRLRKRTLRATVLEVASPQMRAVAVPVNEANGLQPQAQVSEQVDDIMTSSR